jgi:hypothetical protein
VSQALLPVKARLTSAAWAPRGRNFHTDLMRMGFEDEAHKIQDLFFEGKREEAVLAVPDEFADEISLVGPPAHPGANRGAAQDPGHDAADRQPRPRRATAARRPDALTSSRRGEQGNASGELVDLPSLAQQVMEL